MSDIRITPIRVLDDNYVWLIVRGNEAIAFDVGDDGPVAEYVRAHELELRAVIITHHHEDHIAGVADIKTQFTDVQVYAHHSHLDKELIDITCYDGDTFSVLGIDFTVWHTAGHTDTHLTYVCQIEGVHHVFCGDTLFSGGCGRVFTGTMQGLFDSVMRINALPEDTHLYPSHEYTVANLKFGLLVCPQANKEILNDYKQKVEKNLKNNTPSLPTTLKTERVINVFLQTDNEEVAHNVRRIYPKLTDTDAFSVFSALRELKNKF